VHQINIAIGQIDTTTQQNAALVEESVAASEMLNEQARVLKIWSVYLKWPECPYNICYL
jgi:methyl-accepting chemotaxis protein